jgi:hypothetical protein
VKPNSIGFMLTSHKPDASLGDVLRQVVRVASAYVIFALAGITAVLVSYVLADWFSGFVRTILIGFSCVSLLVLLGMFLAYLDPALRERFIKKPIQGVAADPPVPAAKVNAARARGQSIGKE